ncbi:MAG: hypothetical protein N3D11_07080 [Candidatus Sumerlaeia bacterium]|nr:hypothetical protein [Candidatus Sumerlaeia bacterium]
MRQCRLPRRLCAAAVLLSAALLVACARPSLYVYRAYQDPQTAHGRYYLREALVAAPNHTEAMRIVGQTMSELYPNWSGPLYLSLIGTAEDRREPGLLGGPVWLESLDKGNGVPPSATAPGG